MIAPMIRRPIDALPAIFGSSILGQWLAMRVLFFAQKVLDCR